MKLRILLIAVHCLFFLNGTHAVEKSTFVKNVKTIIDNSTNNDNYWYGRYVQGKMDGNGEPVNNSFKYGCWLATYIWKYSGIVETITMATNKDGTLSFIDVSTNGEDPFLGCGCKAYVPKSGGYETCASYAFYGFTTNKYGHKH